MGAYFGRRRAKRFVVRAVSRVGVRDQHERVAVLIATSHGRTSWLIRRALTSVYGQREVDPECVDVVVVDDNSDDGELEHVECGINDLRHQLDMSGAAFTTRVLRNRRTRGHSGTGAWNTGIDLLASSAEPPVWVAILDDDDEYLPLHLTRCLSCANPEIVGVFDRLQWVRAHAIEERPFTIDDLTPEAFFVGNPGVQGSNLFLRLELLIEIGGFDESLPNTTDRDLMIRALRHAEVRGQSVLALDTVGARYHDHDGRRVNTDLVCKRYGLDLFYAKHGPHFDGAALAASLERARLLFGYEQRG